MPSTRQYLHCGFLSNVQFFTDPAHFVRSMLLRLMQKLIASLTVLDGTFGVKLNL